MTTSLRIWSSAILFAALSGCQPQPAAAPVPGEMPKGGTVIATVDGSDVTQEMVDLTIKQLPPQLRAQLEQSGQLGQLEQQVIIGEALYQKAIERKLHEDPDTRSVIALAARSALADALLTKVAEERTTPERIQKHYDDHLVQYKQEQAKARLLVVSADKAEEVKAKLDGGGDFVALVTEYSEDPSSKAKGGDLGWIEKRSMPPNFADPIFGAEKGAWVGPIEAGDKQLFFKVEDKRDATPMADVEDAIKEELKQEIVTEFIEEVEKSAAIERKGAEAAAAPAVAAPAAAAPADAAPAAAAPADAAPADAAPAAAAPAAPAAGADPHGH